MRTPLLLPLPHASQPRAAFWEQVLSEVQRNPALVLVGPPPPAIGPDLRVVDGVVALADAVTLAIADDHAPALEQRRARWVIDQHATRSRDLLAIARCLVGRAVDADALAALPGIHPHRLARYLETARIALPDGERLLASLLAR